MALFERGSVNLARTLNSLRHRNFRLLFFGTSLSHVGDFIQATAQSWLVWILTSSPFLLGLIGFCRAMPHACCVVAVLPAMTGARDPTG